MEEYHTLSTFSLPNLTENQSSTHNSKESFETSEGRFTQESYLSKVYDVKDIGDYPPQSLQDMGNQRRMNEWSPRVFKLKAAVVFVVCLFILTSLAEVFIHKSPYNAPTSTAIILLWTYLPPAVVVFVDWAWQLYDLEIKILQPWALLATGASRREQPWLLDYRSMNYLGAMWHAIRYRHIVVLLTSAGFWIVAVASVMATSLWTIEEVPHTRDASLIVTSAMSHSPNITGPSLQDETYVNMFLAHELFNLSYPRWIVNDTIALESFELSDITYQGANTTLLANTYGYSANLRCNGVDVSWSGNSTVASFTLNVDVGGCGASYTVENSLQRNASSTVNDSQNLWYGFILQHVCPGAPNATTVLTTASLPINGSVFYSTSIACVPQYDQMSVAVTVPPSSTSPLEALALEGSKHPYSFPGGDIFLEDFSNNTGYLLMAGWDNEDSTLFLNSTVAYQTWFMLLQLVNDLSPEAFLDEGILTRTSQIAYAQLWATYAQQSLLGKPMNNQIEILGFSKAPNRLLIARPFSVRIMQAMLVLLAANIILIYVLRPRTRLPFDPSSLTAMAVLLEMSDDSVRTALHGTGEMDERRFEERTKKWYIAVTAQDRFTICADKLADVGEDKKQMENTPSPDTQMQTSRALWRPIFLRPAFQCFLIILLSATIASLEVFYQFSLLHNGIAAFPRGFTSYWWSYVAPTYISLLGVLTACYDFHARALQPYIAMARNPQPLDKSLGYNPGTHTGIGLFLHSLKFRNLVGIATSISLIIVPFIKIAVAGLFVVSPQIVQSGTKLAPLTTFNSTFNLTGMAYDVSDGALSSGEIWPLTRVAEYGLSFPAWTTSREAIGEVDLSSIELGSEPNLTIRAPLSVFSSEFVNCRALNTDEYTMVEAETSGGGTTPALAWYKNNSDLNDSCITALVELPGIPLFFGQLSGAAAEPDYCAGVYFIIYGFSNGRYYQNVTNTTVVTCENNMTISTREVTFSLSNPNSPEPVILSVDESNPQDVQLVNNTIEMSDLLSGGSHFLVPAVYTISTQTMSFDGFFQVLTLQNASAPLWTFGDASILIPAFKELWSSFWAIWVGANMRLPADSAEDPKIDAIMSIEQSRIMQSWVATRVLQALLTVVLLCDIVSIIILRNSGRVLPKAPYSIGAQMSLLVDSSLLDEVAPLRDGLGRPHVLAAVDRSLAAYRFYLGWNSDNLGDPRFGIKSEGSTLT